MTLLLDTSAVIGWFERRNQATVQAVADDGSTPAVHAVTLGELADGWQRAVAERRPKRDIRTRATTFEMVRDEFSIVDDLDPLAYAAIAALARRSLSHNDMWIAAGAASADLALLTEDRDLAALDGESVTGRRLCIRAV
jgi:predicted nucleic acid-binding protein